MGAFYKVVLNGSYMGKDNQNTLWYRAAIDVGGGLFGFGGASELAEEVKQEVLPAYLEAKPTAYTLQTIDVYPLNELLQPIYQLPYKLEVNEMGTATSPAAQEIDSPGLALNIRFNLEPTLIGPQALTAPKRGYVAIGPIPSAWLDNAGRIQSSLFGQAEWVMTRLAAKLSEDLQSIDPPCVFFPVRVSSKVDPGGVPGSPLAWGYADVSSATVDEYATFRRSRRIRG